MLTVYFCSRFAPISGLPYLLHELLHAQQHFNKSGCCAQQGFLNVQHGIFPLHWHRRTLPACIHICIYTRQKEKKLQQSASLLARLQTRGENGLHNSSYLNPLPCAKLSLSLFFFLHNVNSLLHPFISRFPALNSCPKLQEEISTSCAYHRK